MGDPETSGLVEELEVLRQRVTELEAQRRGRDVERALLDSERRYRVLYEENPSMYFTVDSEGMVLSVNLFGADQLGYAVNELIGQPVLNVFHEADRQSVEEQLKICVESPGTAFHWEFRKVRKTGELMWVHEVARARRDHDGKTVVLIVCDDITQRKAAEKELRASRERYRSLYTKTPVMMHSLDPDRRLVDVTDHWLEVLGYERHEVIGRKAMDFLTDESRRDAERFSMVDFYREGKVEDLLFRVVKRNGEIIDVLLSAIVEYDDEGRFKRSLEVLTDVTERNLAELELRRARDEMEARVKDRTAELEKLAGRLLTAQEDERRRLAREMHDDLTQRLAGIALEAGRLQRLLPSASDKASAVLEGVLSDLRRLSSDVHALSRRLHPSILDDLGLVDAIHAECKGIAQRDGITARFESSDVPQDLPSAVALCFYRITQEALRNVAKHAGTPEARVTLTGEAGALTLRVEDRGKGFDSERGRLRKGLGLASMEERARLIGAEFSVCSVRAKGTTVRVTLVHDPSSIGD